MIGRRRFLTVAAAALIAAPGRMATARVWTGRTMGADCRIILSEVGEGEARVAFREVARVLAQAESRWSLFAESDLLRLNRTGRLANPSPGILALFRLAGEVHRATGGAFDPTIQPLWQAIAAGGDTARARDLIGWDRVRISEDAIRLDPGMELTFNGIAQGAAADAVAVVLTARGFGNVLIDTGEQVGLGLSPRGGRWQAAVATPEGRIVAETALADMALATSAPAGTRIGPGGASHILNPRSGRAGGPWQLVSVTAPSAALADALSTACCLLPRPEINRALAAFPGARLAALV